MQLAALLQSKTAEAVKKFYQLEIAPSDIQITTTDAKFEGNFTVVVFPIVKAVKKKPQDVADEIGQFLVKNASEVVARYNAVQGFVNLTLSDAYWLNFLQTSLQSPFAGHATNGKTIVVEYSSPNTNKPLHLGHIRNNLLGFATSNILEAAGYDVKKVQIINDRGIHICKSMLAWQLLGNGETPQSANIKGDHLVGKYYVEFENQFQKEYKNWQKHPVAKAIFNKWFAEPQNKERALKATTSQLNTQRNEETTFKTLISLQKIAILDEVFDEKQFKVKIDKKVKPIEIYTSVTNETLKNILFDAILTSYFKKKSTNPNDSTEKIINYIKKKVKAPHDPKQMKRTRFLDLEEIQNAFIKLKNELSPSGLSLESAIKTGQYLELYHKSKPKSLSFSDFQIWLREYIKKNPEITIPIENYNQLQLSETYFFNEVYKNTYFNEYSTLGKVVKQMLQAWEQGNKEVVSLWQMMNSWVYDGFATTYENLGVSFDKLYYESNTYLTGKELAERSLQSENSIFYKEADGSVWIDLSDVKLDKKAVLRNDGTSMYITQDLGTAYLRFQDFDMDNMIYVVGNEQDYHFQVLFEILKRLGYKFASQCHHLSYGMVNLTTGKMKSREGTVVDADDLMADLVKNVQAESEGRSTLEGETEINKQQIWKTVALGALKFYILKVEPKKSMVFDPKQSIDLQGQTGPYIQNAYVRTKGIGRKKVEEIITFFTTNVGQNSNPYSPNKHEIDVLQLIHNLPDIIKAAADAYNPAEVANYLYNLARAYHKFYNDVVIVDKNDATATKFRLQLNECVAHTLKYAGSLLGINMPERM